MIKGFLHSTSVVTLSKFNCGSVVPYKNTEKEFTMKKFSALLLAVLMSLSLFEIAGITGKRNDCIKCHVCIALQTNQACAQTAGTPDLRSCVPSAVDI